MVKWTNQLRHIPLAWAVFHKDGNKVLIAIDIAQNNLVSMQQDITAD